MTKARFVQLLETLVKAAMPNIKSLEFITAANEEFVMAICEGGAKYTINVSGDSPIAIVYDVINFLRFK